MQIKVKKRAAGDDYSKPGSDKQGQSSGVLDDDKTSKIEVEIHHIFKTDPSNLPFIWKSLRDWAKQWA